MSKNWVLSSPNWENMLHYCGILCNGEIIEWQGKIQKMGWDGILSKLKCKFLHVDFALNVLRQSLKKREKNVDYIRIL